MFAGHGVGIAACQDAAKGRTITLTQINNATGQDEPDYVHQAGSDCYMRFGGNTTSLGIFVPTGIVETVASSR